MTRRLLKAAGLLAGAAALLLAAVLIVLSVSEYKPQSVEQVELIVRGEMKQLSEGDSVSLLTFNIGYAGLDQSMDSFMDGGRQNTPTSRESIEQNMEKIVELIDGQNCDVLLIQEIDRNSKRSYSLDEVKMIQETLEGVSMFAQNYRCLYVPWPLRDTIGPVHSGLMTLTNFSVQTAERIAMPGSVSWPTSVCRMKPCLLVARLPVENSGRELVLINLHMESDEGENGQKEQTEMLFEFMRQEYERGNYVVAGGDFNQVFPEDDFSAYPLRSSEYYEPDRLEGELLDDGWLFVSDLSVPTCRLLNQPYHPDDKWSTQYYVIDGFILSPNLSVDEVETIDAGFEFADHNPVRLKIQLNEE